jgi:hypothetical protein
VIVLAGSLVNEELVQQVRASPIPIVFVTGDPVVEGRRRQHESAGWQRDRR